MLNWWQNCTNTIMDTTELFVDLTSCITTRDKGPLTVNVSLSAGSLRQIQHINLTNGGSAHFTVRWRSWTRSRLFKQPRLSRWPQPASLINLLVSSQVLEICNSYTGTNGWSMSCKPLVLFDLKIKCFYWTLIHFLIRNLLLEIPVLEFPNQLCGLWKCVLHFVAKWVLSSFNFVLLSLSPPITLFPFCSAKKWFLSYPLSSACFSLDFSAFLVFSVQCVEQRQRNSSRIKGQTFFERDTATPFSTHMASNSMMIVMIPEHMNRV